VADHAINEATEVQTEDELVAEVESVLAGKGMSGVYTGLPVALNYDQLESQYKKTWSGDCSATSVNFSDPATGAVIKGGFKDLQDHVIKVMESDATKPSGVFYESKVLNGSVTREGRDDNPVWGPPICTNGTGKLYSRTVVPPVELETGSATLCADRRKGFIPANTCEYMCLTFIAATFGSHTHHVSNTIPQLCMSMAGTVGRSQRIATAPRIFAVRWNCNA
jgi:hypothetical protein